MTFEDLKPNPKEKKGGIEETNAESTSALTLKIEIGLTNKKIAKLLGKSRTIGISDASMGGGCRLFTTNPELHGHLISKFGPKLHMSNSDKDAGLYYLVVNETYDEVVRKIGMPISWMRERQSPPNALTTEEPSELS